MRKKSGAGQTPNNRTGAVPAATDKTETVASNPALPGHGHGHPHIEFKFFEELKHRNVVRVAILYLVVCWLILEPTHVVFHMLEVPAWANRLVLILMAIGLPAVTLFAWAFEITPEGVKPTVDVDPKKSIRSLTGHRLDRAIIVVLVFALAYFVVDKLWLSKREAVAENNAAALPPAPARAAHPEVAVPEKSIAVLPFADMSERHDQEYFSDGLAEEVLDLLAKVPQLHVMARTSSFSFKGKSDDIATIARKLNVAHILEGGVRKSGDRLRVTTQLIRADTGEQIWSQTYDRELKDVFKLQDEIAAAVVEALKVRLLSQPLPSLNRTTNPEALTRYLLGRQFRNRGKLEDSRLAVKAYRKAIELDPNFADAWAELSIAEFYEADQRGDNAGYDRALASAQKAVTLAPERAEGYWARGFLRFVVSWDWDGAQADLARALAIDPDDSTARRYYGNLLADLGRLPEAIAAGKKAADLDPLSQPAWTILARYLAANHDFTGAQEASLRALEIDPENGYSLGVFGQVQLFQGSASQGLATFRKIPLELEFLRLGYVAMAEHSLGHARESQQALDALIGKHSDDSAYQITQVYAWRGEKDKALEWLERAYRQRDGGLSDVKFDPIFQILHGDPRFGALLRKMKLPE